MKPETRYAKSGDVHIAYQVTGSGPIDLVMVPGFMSHLEADWDSPVRTRMLQRIGSFCRLIRFELLTPQPQKLAETLAQLSLQVPIAKGEKAQLRSELTGPKGNLELTS